MDATGRSVLPSSLRSLMFRKPGRVPAWQGGHWIFDLDLLEEKTRSGEHLCEEYLNEFERPIRGGAFCKTHGESPGTAAWLLMGEVCHVEAIELPPLLPGSFLTACGISTSARRAVEWGTAVCSFNRALFRRR